MTNIAVVVSTSPIKSHPSTDILTETLDSIRHHLPDAPIHLTFDGLRSEQIDRKDDYEEYTRRALWVADHKHSNIIPYIFYAHHHQSGMLHHLLTDDFEAPQILYVEHDTPLMTDEEIDWARIYNFIEWGGADLVRFHHEDRIPDEHRHLILDDPTRQVMLPTAQWSQRPHLARTGFYQRILLDHFEDQPNGFIEDRMHGIVQSAYDDEGQAGWDRYRLCIYNPGLGTGMKRSYHLDGRAGEKKYE